MSKKTCKTNYQQRIPKLSDFHLRMPDERKRLGKNIRDVKSPGLCRRKWMLTKPVWLFLTPVRFGKMPMNGSLQYHAYKTVKKNQSRFNFGRLRLYDANGNRQSDCQQNIPRWIWFLGPIIPPVSGSRLSIITWSTANVWWKSGMIQTPLSKTCQWIGNIPSRAL